MAPTRPTSKKTTTDITSRKTSSSATSKKNASSSRGVKQIFRGKEMSIAGEFLNGSSKVPHDKVAAWIEAHGGRFSSDLTADTTHLICSIEEYRKKKPVSPQVQKALALGSKCHIVLDDWLVDCLPFNNNKKKCLKEKSYTLNHVIKRIKKGEKQKEVYKKDFEDSVLRAKELTDSRLYRIYTDQTFYKYQVFLTRSNLIEHNLKAGPVKPRTEKYTLYLFESLACPRIYMFGAKFVKGTGIGAVLYREELRPMMFHDAFRCFTRFFKFKTGIEWDQRYEKLRQAKTAFRFCKPPRPGMPRGLLPDGYIPPDELEESEEEESGDGKEGKGQKDDDITYESDSGDDSEGTEDGGTASTSSGTLSRQGSV